MVRRGRTVTTARGAGILRPFSSCMRIGRTARIEDRSELRHPPIAVSVRARSNDAYSDPMFRKKPFSKSDLEPKRSRTLGVLVILGACFAAAATLAVGFGLAYQTSQFLLRPLVFWLIPFVAAPLVLLARRLMAKSGEAILAKDPRPPIIYLRPFGYDGEKFEPLVSKAVQKWGPMIAVGKPRERFATLGASRTYVLDADWQTHVKTRLSSCQLVILRVGKGEGFRWEVKTAFDILPLQKIVFFFPEGPFGFKRLKVEFSDIVPIILPRSSGAAIFLMFDEDGFPRLLAAPRTSRKRLGSPKQILQEIIEPVFTAESEI